MDFKKLNHSYKHGKEITQWAKQHIPLDDRFIYRNVLLSKTDVIVNLSKILQYPCRVVTTHTSKSIILPVSCFQIAPFFAYVFLRDNLYNIKLTVVADFPIYIPYNIVHVEWSEERYKEELKRYSKYNAGKNNITSGSLDWYKDWAAGSLLRYEGKLYRACSASKCYFEGINRLPLDDETFHIYEHGRKTFVCEVPSYLWAGVIIEYIARSLEKELEKKTRKNTLGCDDDDV